MASQVWPDDVFLMQNYWLICFVFLHFLWSWLGGLALVFQGEVKFKLQVCAEVVPRKTAFSGESGLIWFGLGFYSQPLPSPPPNPPASVIVSYSFDNMYSAWLLFWVSCKFSQDVEQSVFAWVNQVFMSWPLLVKTQFFLMHEWLTGWGPYSEAFPGLLEVVAHLPALFICK